MEMLFSGHEYFKVSKVLNELQTLWIIRLSIKSYKDTNKAAMEEAFSNWVGTNTQKYLSSTPSWVLLLHATNPMFSKEWMGQAQLLRICAVAHLRGNIATKFNSSGVSRV